MPRRGETLNTAGVRWANVYSYKDGEYVALGYHEPHFWENLCRALGRKDLIPYYNLLPEKRDEVIAILEQIFITRTRYEWQDFFQDKEICFGPVYYLKETLSHPQVLHRNMVLEADHPILRKVRQIVFPIKLSETPARLRSLGVTPGTHAEEILEILGYSKEDIRTLQESRAFGAEPIA